MDDVYSEATRLRFALEQCQEQLRLKSVECRSFIRYFNAARYVAFYVAFRYGSSERIDDLIQRKHDQLIQEEETNAKNPTARIAGDA